MARTPRSRLGPHMTDGKPGASECWLTLCAARKTGRLRLCQSQRQRWLDAIGRPTPGLIAEMKSAGLL